MQCRNCGATLEPEALYCQDCGTPIDGQPPRPVQIQGQTAFKPAQAETRRRISPRNIAIGLICIALIVGAACVVATGLGLSPTSQGAGDSSSQTSSGNSRSMAAEDKAASSSEASSSDASEESSESSSSASAEEMGFNQVKAEEQARKGAVAEGMQVITGTVHMTTYGQRAAEVDERLIECFSGISDRELALFVFGVGENLSAVSPASGGAIETRPNQTSLALSNPGQWWEYDGQLITIAAFPDEMMFPNDVAGLLYSAAGSAEIIAPLTEESAAQLTYYRTGGPMPELPTSIPTHSSKSSASKSASSESSSSAASASSESSEASASSESSSSAASPSDGSYILPASDSRIYTKADLSGLSDYDLFIARNEIYARHGRKFQSADLQEYFNSKGWYDGTIEAGSFDESVLNDTEIANASLIREIEESHNSKYL